jgi:hypothetical protein
MVASDFADHWQTGLLRAIIQFASDEATIKPRRGTLPALHCSAHHSYQNLTELLASFMSP